MKRQNVAMPCIAKIVANFREIVFVAFGVTTFVIDWDICFTGVFAKLVHFSDKSSKIELFLKATWILKP